MARILLALLMLLGLSGPAWAQATVVQQALSAPGTVPLNLAGMGFGTVTIQASGSATGLAFTFQVTTDNQTWFTLANSDCIAEPAGTTGSSGSANGNWRCLVIGFASFRVNLTAVTGTETFTIVGAPGTAPSTSGGGGSTTANQGTAAADNSSWPVHLVQGTTANSSANPIFSSDTTKYAQGSTTSGQVGPLVQGAVTTGAPTDVTAQTAPLSLTTGGALRVNPTTTLGSSLNQGFTTPAAATNIGFGVGCIFNTSAPALTNTQMDGCQFDAAGNILTGSRPLAPIVSSSAENNHVLKNSAANLLSVHASNVTSTSGYMVVLNATSAPADGAITPLACRNLPANGEADIPLGVPGVYSTGITVVLTSASSCFTKTTGVITGFITGAVQ